MRRKTDFLVPKIDFHNSIFIYSFLGVLIGYFFVIFLNFGLLNLPNGASDIFVIPFVLVIAFNKLWKIYIQWILISNIITFALVLWKEKIGMKQKLSLIGVNFLLSIPIMFILLLGGLLVMTIYGIVRNGL